MSEVRGRVQIRNEVIDSIVAMAAAQVQGVEEVLGFDKNHRRLRMQHEVSLFSRADNGRIQVNLAIRIDPHYRLIEVVEEVQLAVAQSMDVMLNFSSALVNVTVVA